MRLGPVGSEREIHDLEGIGDTICGQHCSIAIEGGDQGQLFDKVLLLVTSQKVFLGYDKLRFFVVKVLEELSHEFKLVH